MEGGRSITTWYFRTVYLPYHLTGPSTIISGLSNGRSYSFTVCAHNLAGNGSRSTR